MTFKEFLFGGLPIAPVEVELIGYRLILKMILIGIVPILLVLFLYDIYLEYYLLAFVPLVLLLLDLFILYIINKIKTKEQEYNTYRYIFSGQVIIIGVFLFFAIIVMGRFEFIPWLYVYAFQTLLFIRIRLGIIILSSFTVLMGYVGFFHHTVYSIPTYDLLIRAIPALFILSLFILGSEYIRRNYGQQLEASLKEVESSQKRLQIIMDSLDANIYVADLKSHEILFANNFAIKYFGPDLEGKTCWKAIRNEESPCLNCSNESLIAKDGDPFGAVISENFNPIIGRWFRNYDLAIKWVDDRTVRLHIGTDVTNQKEADEKKLALETQLLQAQKMEAVGTLAGGIAHDFNNILTAILGYSEIALMNLEKGILKPQTLNGIMAAGEKAKELVKQILAFSRRLEPELRPMDLNRVIEDNKLILERTIPKMISIELNLDQDLRLVYADQNQVSQVLMNLGGNAKDAMPEGGRLIIETKNITINHDYRNLHPEIESGDYVQLAISDTGHGIDKETLPQIFDPFFTKKEVGKGTGLGLSTVYGIVQSHNGYISCSSEVGNGTTFNILLPAIKTPDYSPIVKKREIEIDGGSETILLVDDEESIRDYGEQILTNKGYKVLLARTGEEAIEVYSKKDNAIDLVILDISMPGMGGHKCLQKLTKINPGIKAIIASGYSLSGQLQEVIDSGANDYIAKPFLSTDLLNSIRKVIDGN